MKATLLKSVAVIALVFAGVFNANLNAGNKFVSNDEVKDGVVVSKIIYRYDGYLHNHIKYNYTYDVLGQVTSKETYKWNESISQWMPSCKLNYTYNENDIVVELYKWDSVKKEYSKPKARNVYELDETNLPVALVSYNWNERDNRWKISDNIPVDQNVVLLAINK